MVMRGCLSCGSRLEGRQTKYCSRRCKNTWLNAQLQSYQAQQIRGRSRKLELVRLMGGKCAHCGYGGNYAALEFHHLRPDEKKFQLDLRSLSNRGWGGILAEARKCKRMTGICVWLIDGASRRRQSVTPYQENCATSRTASDGAACAGPWLRSGGCARA